MQNKSGTAIHAVPDLFCFTHHGSDSGFRSAVIMIASTTLIM